MYAADIAPNRTNFLSVSQPHVAPATYGANSCKGTSVCATSKHDCKGLNGCKG